MARLIDADALEAKLEEQRKLYIDMDMKGAEHLLVHDVLHYVWEAPTIDAVPATIEGALGYLHSVGWIQEHDRIMTEDVVQVIRCKDCKYYDTPKNFKKPYCMRGAYVKVNADDYCSKGGEKMTDYIKREDALKAVDAFIGTDPIAERIKLIPSVDVAPVRHGRWKPFDRTWGRSVFTCSACGECMDVPTEMGKPIFDYCPNCGAKMDEEE